MYHGPGIEAEPLVGEDGGGEKCEAPEAETLLDFRHAMKAANWPAF